MLRKLLGPVTAALVRRRTVNVVSLPVLPVVGALHGSRVRRHGRSDDPDRAGRLHRDRAADGGRGPLGDYSDLTIDPADDCTFWYTQEYLATDTVLLGTSRTRIASFEFPGCRH